MHTRAHIWIKTYDMCFIIFVMRGIAKQSSQLCTHANACDFIIHWIATVTAFPRDDKIRKCVNKKIKHRAKFPSVGGVPRSGGVVRECKNAFPFCPPGTLPHTPLSLRAIADGVAIQ